MTFLKALAFTLTLALSTHAQDSSGTAIPVPDTASTATKPLPTPAVTTPVVHKDEGIKFSLPITDTTIKAKPDSVHIQPTSSKAVQTSAPVAVTQNTPRKLNLDSLTRKDSDSFDVYSDRLTLIGDSTGRLLALTDSVTKATEAGMQKPAPKGEFEKQSDFEKRKMEWNTEKTERINVACKPLNERLAELKKARKKIEEIQVSMLGTVKVVTEPAGAYITLGKEKNGVSPVEAEEIIPGTIPMSIRKEDFNPIDTTIVLKPGAKLSLTFSLTEKSIFSTEDEIDLGKILARDSNRVEIYQKRIKQIGKRQQQVDGEIKIILAKFPDTYPRLAPQKAGESEELFNARKDNWAKEGTRRYNRLKYRHTVYRARLDRAVEVLRDYMIRTELAETLKTIGNAGIALGKYDSEKEKFELTVSDTASRTAPFLFIGSAGIPLATAKKIDHSTEGFMVTVAHLDCPFVTDSGNVNLAMSRLDLSYQSKPVDVSGSFLEIPRYAAMPGYPKWRTHVDSLLRGTLKVRNLDASYALDWEPQAQTDGGPLLGWRGWSRVVLFTAAAVFGGVAIYENHEASDKADNAHPTTEAQAKSIRNDIQDHDDMRDIMLICTGASAGLGLITFAF